MQFAKYTSLQGERVIETKEKERNKVQDVS